MLRFLVAIDHTVESGFALRLACRVAAERGDYLQALHVLDPSALTLDSDAGWTIHTYKRERMRNAYLDMARIIASESETCASIPDLKVAFGDAAKTITREAAEGAFDVLFMGSVHPLVGAHRGILLKILRKVTCPIVLLKDYRPLKRVLLHLDEPAISETVMDKGAAFLQGLGVHLDLAAVQEPGDRGDDLRSRLETARERMASVEGIEPAVRLLPGDPLQVLPEVARDYDLVVTGTPPRRRPGPLLTHLIQTMPAPLMLCL